MTTWGEGGWREADERAAEGRTDPEAAGAPLGAGSFFTTFSEAFLAAFLGALAAGGFVAAVLAGAFRAMAVRGGAAFVDVVFFAVFVFFFTGLGLGGIARAASVRVAA